MQQTNNIPLDIWLSYDDGRRTKSGYVFTLAATLNQAVV